MKSLDFLEIVFLMTKKTIWRSMSKNACLKCPLRCDSSGRFKQIFHFDDLKWATRLGLVRFADMTVRRTLRTSSRDALVAQIMIGISFIYVLTTTTSSIAGYFLDMNMGQSTGAAKGRKHRIMLKRFGCGSMNCFGAQPRNSIKSMPRTRIFVTQQAFTCCAANVLAAEANVLVAQKEQ